MIVGICVCYNTNGVTHRNVHIDFIGVFQSSSVANDITEVLLLDDGVFPNTRLLLHGTLRVTDSPEELCHG